MSVFYELKSVPVHSVLLMPTKEKAHNFPKGDISLGFCPNCGFISNLAFDPRVHEYSSQYEETQGFSSTFNEFHKRLATQLIDRYDLHHKDIIEIGCGKGEFLTLLCEQGDNRGVGFDPAYVSERNPGAAAHRVTFIPDFYSEKYAHYRGDFIVCKMTLEHIHKTADFVSTVRRSISELPDSVVFFQVPEVTRILRELAFWDIYYEHCSYFSPGSLARLFQNCGFQVTELWTDYNDQYLMIAAQPADGTPASPLPLANDLESLAGDVAYFAKNCRHKLQEWERYFQEVSQKGHRVVLWGGSSKAVAFLTTLNIQAEIQYVVDINLYKHKTYIAGTGQEIVAPEFLQEYRPDAVIIMNPIYREEIRQDLNKMGLAPELITV
ncbi:MAG: class I SAM-dependent methyltransferase [Desulfobacteraceae bacterium]